MALEVFYSYSHKDEKLREQLGTHLASLQREGLIRSWSDHCIRAGGEWRGEIDEHVRSAGLILLLISPDFMASDYCFDIEMKTAMERHEKNEAIVVPILIKSCDWKGAPFSKLQALPRDGKAVDLWPVRNQAFMAMAKELRERVTRKAEDDGPARQKYLAWVEKQHRYIRFSGLAEVDERAEVEMARVFVMPRVVRQAEAAEPVAAQALLAGQSAANRLMILGGPGSGKTTLLEAFALGFVQPEKFEWAGELSRLLPVFYRIRELDKDLQAAGGTIWDCMQRHFSEGMQDPLPKGFFKRQMQAGGIALLLDGLDEASSFARRNGMVDLIGALADQFSGNSRLIVTSRPHDYRHRLDEASWMHVDLAEFDDGEIQTFIAGWQKIHQPDRAAARDRESDLWQALESRKDILPLARNALLLTMIVRVHFGLGALPDSRLGLYEKCTETLLKHWAEAKGLAASPIDTGQKRKLLQRLAYEMQGEAEEFTREMTLQITRGDLERRLEKYLEEEGCADHFHLVEKVIERLHARDAILVQYGADQTGQDKFGFIHRSFQEYFAAGWMAHEIDDEEFRRQLLAGRDGWDETFYLAVAQLADKKRRGTLLELLKRGKADTAVECLRAAAPEQPWLRLLVQFLARYTGAGSEYRDLTANECAGASGMRAETMSVLRAMFERENREGQSLAAAVELAEELRRRGVSVAFLDEFFAEAKQWPEDMVTVAGGLFLYGEANEMVDLPTFRIDRFPVTNEEYERMIPGHRAWRGQYSDEDRQPVIYVSWFEARLYARWRGCRLPSEREWEKAASWDAASQKKRVYPWGDEFDGSLCNRWESRICKTAPVGFYPLGVSAYGAQDMAGNVWEWTESPWEEGGETRVVRGGSWVDGHGDAACARRDFDLPDLRYYNLGLRCART